MMEKNSDLDKQIMRQQRDLENVADLQRKVWILWGGGGYAIGC